MNLVTGATGIVGMPLVVKLLQSGEAVRALRRATSDTSLVEAAVQGRVPEGRSRLEWVEGDLTDQASLEAALEGVQRVFHCAALVSFHPKDHGQMDRINAQGTAHLVDAMLHCGTPRLLHVSSVAALGRKEGQPTNEDTLFEEQPGTTGYARSKHRAEMEAWRGSVEGLPGGLVVVHPTVVLGPGDFSRSSGALFDRIARGLAWYPKGSNGFVGSEDVAEACVRLGLSEVRDARFVLCAEQWTYEAMMKAIALALQVRPPHRPVHRWMVGWIWRALALVEALTGRRSVATRESLANTGAHHTYEGTRVVKAMEGLGISWSYTPIGEVIEQTAKVYLLGRSAGREGTRSPD